ncbi:hypothetical protein QQF64_034828, partial [Cirrhinus molitorella]
MPHQLGLPMLPSQQISRFLWPEWNFQIPDTDSWKFTDSRPITVYKRQTHECINSLQLSSASQS